MDLFCGKANLTSRILILFSKRRHSELNVDNQPWPARQWHSTRKWELLNEWDADENKNVRALQDSFLLNIQRCLENLLSCYILYVGVYIYMCEHIFLNGTFTCSLSRTQRISAVIRLYLMAPKRMRENFIVSHAYFQTEENARKDVW